MIINTLLVIILMGISFYLGGIFQELPISNALQSITSVETGPRSFPENIPEISAVPQKIARANTSNDAYNSSNNQDKVTVSGNFTIPDSHKTAYNFSFSKNGGSITGSLKGTCNGQITGQSEPQGENQKARFTGLLEAKCEPMVNFSWKIDMRANLEGVVDYKSGKIYVIYDFSQPYSLRGSTNINFTP